MKTPLNKICMQFTYCVLLFGMLACDNSLYQTDILLRANFNGDILGHTPDKTLPGDPVGDELDYGGQALSVINSPFSGGAPYALRQPFSIYSSPAIKYVAKPSPFSGVIHCGWNGQLVDLMTTHQVLVISIDDGQGKLLVELVIAGQGLYVLSQGDGSWYFGDHLAYPFPRGTSKHVFMIDVDYAHKTFDLILAGQDLTQNVFKYTNLPIYDPNVVLSANTRPTLRIYGYVGAGGNPYQYVVDNVTISREYISLPDVDL